MKFLIWFKYHFGSLQDRITALSMKMGWPLDIRPGGITGEIMYIAFVNPDYKDEYDAKRPSFLNRAQRRSKKFVVPGGGVE